MIISSLYVNPINAHYTYYNNPPFQNVTIGTDGYVIGGADWYKLINITYIVVIPISYNATHSFIADSVLSMIFIYYRPVSSEQFKLDWLIKNYNSTGMSYYTIISDNTMNFPMRTVDIHSNLSSYRHFLRIDINTFEVKLILRIRHPIALPLPEIKHLCFKIQMSIGGEVEVSKVGDLITTLITFSVNVLVSLIFPIAFSMKFGKKGAGIGFIFSGIYNYFTYENLFFAFFFFLIAFLILRKDRIERGI